MCSELQYESKVNLWLLVYPCGCSHTAVEERGSACGYVWMHLCVFVNKRVHDMFMHKVTSFHSFCFVAVVLIGTINMNDIYSSYSSWIFFCDIRLFVNSTSQSQQNKQIYRCRICRFTVLYTFAPKLLMTHPALTTSYKVNHNIRTFDLKLKKIVF